MSCSDTEPETRRDQENVGGGGGGGKGGRMGVGGEGVIIYGGGGVNLEGSGLSGGIRVPCWSRVSWDNKVLVSYLTGRGLQVGGLCCETAVG